MSGRKQKPCEFCEDEVFGDYQEHKNGFMMYYEWYPYNGLFSVIGYANDECGEMQEDVVEFKFNYCPICGRKLN